MKYLVLLLALVGCSNQNLYSRSPGEEPDIIGSMVEGNAAGVMYQCQETQINDKLVWIPCKFRNISFETKRTCLQISYRVNATNTEVVESRKICSSFLRPDETYENYGAFIKEKRERLTKECGVDLSACRMVVKAF